MNLHATVTIAIFAAVVLLDALGLGFDLGLFLGGRKTISEYVWETPELGLPILALQALGLIALTSHFYDAR